MKIKSITPILFAVAMLLYQKNIVHAQENSFSQENAEKLALQKYEAEHPPLTNMVMPEPAENEAMFGAHLIRTASLLENSNRAKHLPVKILIYGQSIVGSTVFTEQISKYIREKFPNAAVTIENRAIGGFTANHIIRTAVHDLYPYNPDLLIFHVYGGEKTGELEQLFSNVRKYTNADILLMSHHLNANQSKPDEMQAKYLQYIASKYDCELADICAEWPKYLASNRLKPTDLLRDGVHPNRNGNWLLAQLVGRHIRYNPAFSSQWYKSVRSYYPVTAFDKDLSNPISLSANGWSMNNGTAVSSNKQSSLKFSFTGNRVDLISGHPLNLATAGTARILLDGKPITAANTVYTISRPSPGPGTWWPAIRQVGHSSPLLAEDWTLQIFEISADSTTFKYRVKGSVTGNDGEGNSKEQFTSRSGRVVIQSNDVMLASIARIFKVTIPVGFEVKWSVTPLFGGQFTSTLTTDASKVYQTNLVQGIHNGPHTIEIIPSGDGPVAIESLEVYQPGLK